jgi:signal transduction histidine kinase
LRRGSLSDLDTRACLAMRTSGFDNVSRKGYQMPDRVRGWFSGAPFGLRALTRLDTLLALVVSAGAVVVVSGVTNSDDPQGGFLACVSVLLMTAPVAWRRAHPLGAVATLAGGALFNAIVVGSFVRCGGTLPALALVVYSVGARCELRAASLGAALGVVSAVTQGFSDPQLKGFAIGGSVLTLLMWGVGRLVRSRERMVAALRTRTDELRRERDRRARLAVAADRARVAADLDGMLGARIGKLASEAAAARELIAQSPEAAEVSLTAIEHEGREALGDMREIVGELRDEPALRPQPSLDDIGALLERTLACNARLTVDGDRHKLPAGIELSAFRIVERLLEPLEGVPDARVHVTLRYAPDVLEVRVRGRLRSGADLHTTLATAGEWVSLHAGTIDSQLRSGVSQTDVRLPLVTAYA